MDAPSDDSSLYLSVYVLGALGFIFTVLQLQLIYIIFAYKDFRTNLTCIIIAIGSVTELAQNVSHFYSAICLFFDNPLIYQISKVFGALTVASFSSSISVNFVLGLNRLDVFKPSWITFNIKDAYLIVLLVLISVISVALFVLSCTPMLVFIFTKSNVSWMFHGELASPFMNLSFWINSVCLCGTLVCYVLIFYTIVTKRKLITTGSTKVASSEIKLLIGATLQFVLVLIVNIALKFQSSLPHLFIYVNLTLTCGAKPIIHLSVNKKLRKRYFKGLYSAFSSSNMTITRSGQLPYV
uniref:Serpentine receptor class gamma n=1 Tax=Panagrellus redivivus TaxID=6233 RepID=A0A7E4WCE7_PANRE